MCWGRKLGRIHRSGDIDVFPKLLMAREPTTDDCKSQGTQNDSRFKSQNKWSEVDGMKFAGRRALRHPPSSNISYSTRMYNMEERNEQYVPEPVTVSGMAVMQSQDNWGMVDSGFNFLRTRAWRCMVTEWRKHRLDIQTGTSLRHRRHWQRLHRDWKLNQSMETNSDRRVRLLKSNYDPTNGCDIQCSVRRWHNSTAAKDSIFPFPYFWFFIFLWTFSVIWKAWKKNKLAL